MANILKNGKVYRTRFGQNLSDAYMVVDRVSLDKVKKYAQVSVKIYPSKEIREEAKTDMSIEPLVDAVEEARGDIYDAFFPMFTEQPTNVFQQAYNFLLNDLIEKTGDTEEDGQVVPVFESGYRDWET